MIWRLALGLLVAAAIVVIGLQIRENTGQPEVGPTGPTTVLVPIVASPTTPLPRDSGPENNAPRKGKPRTAGADSRSRGNNGAGRSTPTTRAAKPHAPRSVGKRSKPRKPPKAHSPPRRPDSPEKPRQPPSAPPQSKPPPVVTVPSPKVCVNGLVEVGDCG